MWVAQHCGVHRPENHLSSGGLGTRATACQRPSAPARATRRQRGSRERRRLVHDEPPGLATLKRYDLDVKMVLLDNSCLGMVRQWQELFLEERYSEPT